MPWPAVIRLSGEHADVLPEDYDRLPSVRSGAEYLAMATTTSQARSVRDWSQENESP
jgi:hypothetical protein